jgi:hypothetical protein
MVRAGLVTRDTLDDFVRRQIEENPELCCSPGQLSEYVLVLLES